MYSKRPDVTYDEKSLTCWKDKMSNFDRNLTFRKDIAAKGRMVWATNVIKTINLYPDCAKTFGKYNNEDFTINFDVDNRGHLVSQFDLKDNKISSVICAACIEIDMLLSTQDTGEHDYDENLLMKQPQISDNEKCLLVKITIENQNLVLRSFLDNDTNKPIFMQTNRGLSKISGDHKKINILRLLLNAKKANCKFCFEHRDYRIYDLRDAISFYDNKLQVWQKYFNVELTDECELLSRRLIHISTCAQITAIDGSNIKITWKIFSNFGEINFEYLSALMRANGRPIFLKNIGVVLMTESQVDVIRTVLSFKISDDVFPYYMLYFLANQSAISIETDLKINDSFVESSCDLPLLDCLKEYQANGVRWMRSVLDSGCQCLLADEMGLGKTLQALSLICSDSNAKTSLIICPASVISVWEREIMKFFPEKSISSLGSGGFSEANFILSSYNQARRLNSLVSGKKFDYLVLDEAQYIKNSSSKTARACCSIQTKYKIAITGTPIENNLNDVWSIFRFLMPGLLHNYRDFQKMMECQEFKSKLKKQIAPFILRRTKDSVRLQIPEKNEIELMCPLTSLQSKIYNMFRERLSIDCQNYNKQASSKERMNILTTIMRMRQACDCVDILPSQYKHRDSECPKLDALMLKLEEIAAEGKKAIIFSQFLGFLSKIGTEIQEMIPVCEIFKLTGSTNNRKALVDNFQSHNGAATMLISLRAGGVGVTLHSAEYAFLMEPWWNPAVEEQAIARIHRIGQEKITTVYRMISPGTIEQHMRAIQIKKKDLFDEVIQDSDSDISFTNFYIQNIDKF